MWQKLAKNLAVLITNYQKLLKLNEEKHGVLVLVQIQALEKIVHQEEEIIKAINKAEKERQNIILSLAGEYPLLHKESRMKDVLAECKDDQQRILLQRLHTMLNKLVKQTQEASSDNEFLISAALDAINFKLNQLGGATVEPGYGNQGQELVSHSSNFNLET